MYRLTWKYTKDGWWAALLGPLLVIIECVFDTIIPYVMSLIIDEGITARGGDIDFIIKMGIIMLILAIIGGACGAFSGIFASIASCRFVKNIRMAMLNQIQKYDFNNIEKFPVPTVVMRMTTDMRMLRMAYLSIVRVLFRTPINIVCCCMCLLYSCRSLLSFYCGRLYFPRSGRGVCASVVEHNLYLLSCEII